MKKENILKFYRTYRLYVFPTIIAVLSLFLIVFLIYPQIVKLISNQKDEGELINKSKFLETKVSAMESYNIEDLSHKLEIALNAYPDNKDYSVVMSLLQQLVAKSGFKTVAIAQGSNFKAAGGSDSYELKLEIVGVKPNLPILLNNLESSLRLIRVNSIDAASTNNSEGLNVSLVVGVLFGAIPKNLGSLDSPLPDFSQKDEDLIARLVEAGGVPLESGSASTPRGKSNPFE